MGVIAIPEVESFMTKARSLLLRGEIPELLLFMAHPKTVAVGLKDLRTERPEDLLVPPSRLEKESIALTRSVRGGGITYHWPGQLVCYPIISLRRKERNVPEFMWKLEQVGIETLRRFGIEALRSRADTAHVGLWHRGRKVVSMGVRISGRVTSFGFAINLEGDYAPARYIRPCGIEDARLVTVEDILGHAPSRSMVLDAVKESFSFVFSRVPEKAPQTLLAEIRGTVA
jgi:lipoate-protein ligase B